MDTWIGRADSGAHQLERLFHAAEEAGFSVELGTISGELTWCNDKGRNLHPNSSRRSAGYLRSQYASRGKTHMNALGFE